MLGSEVEHLLAGLDPELRALHGVPTPSVAQRRVAAYESAVRRCARGLPDAVLRVSPLGPAWSGDIDVHVAELPAPELLASWGWLDLDRLLRRLGSGGRGRWAVREDGRVLGRVDLQARPAPEPVQAVLERCRRRGEVRLREVLELRALVTAGAALPRTHPALVAAADLEAARGGATLRPWASGQPPRLPVPLPAPLATPRARRFLGRARRALRRRGQCAVALSGVDGAGKSTLCGGLVAQLEAAGVDVDVVWTRPGMGLGWLSHVARRGKRLLGQSPEPGVRAVAAGAASAPASRRGVVGWVWTLAVTVSFLATARRQPRRPRAVVVYDRHVLDALATLSVLYGGVRLGLPRALVRWLLPRADTTVYLRVPVEVAVARKPGDTIGASAVRRQLEEYDRSLSAARRMLVLDATRAPDELLDAALRHVLRTV